MCRLFPARTLTHIQGCYPNRTQKASILRCHKEMKKLLGLLCYPDLILLAGMQLPVRLMTPVGAFLQSWIQALTERPNKVTSGLDRATV